MKKHGASPALTARALIMRENDHHIIEMIGTAHGLMAGRIGQPHRPVVVRVASLVAPAIGSCRSPFRKRRPWRENPVGAIHDLQESPTPHGSCTIAFPFHVAAARPAHEAGKLHCSRGQYALPRSHADRANVNICDDFPHGDLSCGRCYQQAKVTVTAIAGMASHPPETFGNDHH